MTAPVRGSLRCPVPGCGGMLRPETNGMGRLIEICDLCVARTVEHARMGHYFRSLEKRIAVLESAVAQGIGRSSSAVRAREARDARAVDRPSAPRSAGRITRLHLGAPSRSSQILGVLQEAGRPLMMADIIRRCRDRAPEYSGDRVRDLVYNLAQRGILVTAGRDESVRGWPKLYTLAPEAAQPSSGEPIAAHAANPHRERCRVE